MIGWTYFYWGIEQFNAGNFPECLDKLHTLLTEYGTSEAAPTGARTGRHHQAQPVPGHPAEPSKKKAEALKDMIESAQYTIHTWPDKPAADDARMSLGQVYFYNGEIDKALNSSTPSIRRRSATPWPGTWPATYCQRYLREKRSPRRRATRRP